MNIAQRLRETANKANAIDPEKVHDWFHAYAKVGTYAITTNCETLRDDLGLSDSVSKVEIIAQLEKFGFGVEKLNDGSIIISW